MKRASRSAAGASVGALEINYIFVCKVYRTLPTPSPSPSPSPSPPPSPPVIVKFNGSSHPVGLFRDQAAGLYSDGESVCYFSDGSHLLKTGFTQAEYSEARQIPLKDIKLPSIGLCKTNDRYGLVRNNMAGLIKHKSGLCILASGEHLQKCGFRQKDYDSAPQIKVSDPTQLPTCSCP